MVGRPEQLEQLARFARYGRQRFDENGELELGYVEGVLIRALDSLMPSLCRQVWDLHTFPERHGEQSCVVHYTSVETLVSMLKDTLLRVLRFCGSTTTTISMTPERALFLLTCLGLTYPLDGISIVPILMLMWSLLCWTREWQLGVRMTWHFGVLMGRTDLVVR